MCDNNNNNIVNQFDQAVSAFLNGDHQTGTSILHVLQETPGGIAETLLSHVLLCPTGRVLGDYTETGSVHLPREEIIRRVQRHFYAFRLISVEICHSWESKWNALNEELLTFIHVSYVAVNGEILTADATALASAGVSASIGKPLLAEYASLAAIIWKLRVASAVASSSEDSNTNNGGDQSRLILQQLRSQLFSSEFIFQHTPYSHRGMVCAVLISIVEEFGLFHKAAIQRCIPFRLHESTRKLFMSEVLAHDDGQAGCAGMLKLCVDLLTDERNRCQLTLGDGGDPEHAIVKLGEVIKVLMALLSWRFDDAFWFDGDTIAANISDAGKASMPTSLEISGDNKNDAAWSTVLAAPVRGEEASSVLTADAPLSRLVAPLRDHLYGAQSQDPTQVSELSILSLVGSTVALLGGLQCAEYAKGQSRPLGIDETISVVQSDLLACLVQLSSVHCKFWTPEQRAFYAGHCWALSMRLCDTSLWSICTTSMSQQSGGATLPEQPTAWRIAGCQAIFRIISSIGTQDSIFYHPNLCDHFINPLKELSLYLISRLDAVTATQEKNWANESAEDDLLESLDLILQGWLKIMQAGTWNVTNRVKLGEVTVGILAAGASDVLQSFMTAKIKLHSDLCVSDDSSETVHAVEYANSNLQLLATIGRESAGSSAYLSTMVETVAIGQYLNAFLDKGQEPPVGLSEAVWYVISICAEFVGDAPDSERPCIAMPFVSQAMRLERRFPDSVTDQITNSPFFSMCNNILSFTDTLVDRYLATGAGHVISPGVCAALLEFFRRYIASFLFADESLQSDYSPVFDVVFDSGALVAKLALKLSIACLHCYTHNSDVVENVGKLFETCITLPPQFSAWMFSSQGESLQTLCTLAFENWVSASGGPMLSGSTRGKVLAFLFSLSADASVDAIQAAVAATTNQGNTNNGGGGGGGGMFGGFGGGDPMEAIKKIPLASLDCPLKTLYAELSGNVEGIISQCAALQVSSVVIDVLETLKGGTNGLSSEQASALIFTGGYTQLIEMTFRAATTMFEQTGDKRLIVSSANLLEHVIGFFVPAETYKCVIQLAIELCSFSQKAMEDSHQSVQNASSDMKNFEEDERIGVLTATSTMLYQIATWAVLDFQESVPNADGTSSPESTTVPTLVVNGLLIVLRYLDESTALIPSLRTSIFSLLNEVGVSYTGSLLGRCTEEDSNLVLQAIQFASTSGVSDLIRTACAVMKAFGKHARKHNAQHLANLTLMFLQRLVQMILRESLDPSTIPSVASALFELVELHGVEAFQSTMASASGGLSGQHVCAAARLCEEYGAIDRTSWRRAMNPVTSAVEKCVLAAQGGRVL